MPLPIDASYALSRLQWRQEKDLTLWRSTGHVLLPWCYCIRQLAGEFVSDPLSSIGLVNVGSRFIPERLNLVPEASARLPPLNDMTAVAGAI